MLTEIDRVQDLLDGDIPINEETAARAYQLLCEAWPGLEDRRTETETQ